MEHPIFQKIENANKPDFGDILSKSFDLFKRVWEQALYHVLISMVAVMPMILLIYVPYFMFIFSLAGQDPYGQYEQPDLTPYIPGLIAYAIVVLLFIFIVQAIVLGVAAHFYKVLKNTDLEEHTEVGGYFDLVKTNFKKLLLLSLATFGIGLLAALLCYIPIFYVMVPLQLVGVIYAFHPDLTVKETIKACFKLGNKFWLTIFGLILIGSIIAQAGMILCFVGVIFTAYFVHIPIYYVYKDAIGFGEEPEDVSLLIS